MGVTKGSIPRLHMNNRKVNRNGSELKARDLYLLVLSREEGNMIILIPIEHIPLLPIQNHQVYRNVNCERESLNHCNLGSRRHTSALKFMKMGRDNLDP